MLTGEIRRKVDQVWTACWAAGISNPIEVIDQLTYLIFLRGLDAMEQREEHRSRNLKEPRKTRFYPQGKDERGRDYEDLRWSRFKHMAPDEMYEIVSEHVFPFLRSLGARNGSYARHMKEAMFRIPSAGLLAKVVDMVDELPMEDRDTRGELYEYVLSQRAAAGLNGRFRTPRHIIRLIVEIGQPRPGDVVCDPGCGTCGFLVGASEYIPKPPLGCTAGEQKEKHSHEDVLHGFDFDITMPRIGSMNMMTHCIKGANVAYRDSLSDKRNSEATKYTLVLANPPFARSFDYENTGKDLLQIIKTKKTELLLLALFSRTLKPGGQAAVIVPDAALFGSSKADRTLRQMVLEGHKIDGVVSLRSGAIKTYAGVTTAILIFTKTNSGGTDHVRFYDAKADGLSFNNRFQPLLIEDKLGPLAMLPEDEHGKNNLPDALKRWFEREAPRAIGHERRRATVCRSRKSPRIETILASTGMKRSSTKRSSTVIRKRSSPSSGSWRRKSRRV